MSRPVRRKWLLLYGALSLGFSAAAIAAEVDPVTVDAQTADVIAGGLKYLAGQQNADGSWSSKGGNGGYPVAMTGYALMAMMSAGNLPEEGKYRENVAAGMRYLLAQVQPNGLFHGVDRGKYMYSHGIGTLALAELYGESSSEELRGGLERLIAVIVSAQSLPGGWRYAPDARDADISATVPQLAALRAAENAGLSVPRAAIDKAVEFVRNCGDARTGGFAYQPGQTPGFARTAAAIYSLEVCGEYEDPRIRPGSDFLFAHVNDHMQWWPYGNYYAAPAQYMIGGDTWRRWYGQIEDQLMASVIHQDEESYWNDRRSEGLGPVYSTAVYLTILAIPYHYLPLYQR